MLSASRRLRPPDPLGAKPPDPHYRLALRALAMGSGTSAFLLSPLSPSIFVRFPIFLDPENGSPVATNVVLVLVVVGFLLLSDFPFPKTFSFRIRS